MLSWEEKPFQPPNRARGPWEEIHTSGWWLVKSRASLQMGLEELADLSGRWSNSGMFTSGKHSVMPTQLPQLPEKVQSVLFFLLFTELFPFRDLGGKRRTAALRPWRLGTHPPYRIAVVSVHIYTARVLILCHQMLLLMSILPFCVNKGIKKHHHRLLFQFLPTRPTFLGSSLDGDDGKLGQTEEENRTGTNRHPRHGTALGTRRAVTHLRRMRTSTPVSRLNPSLFQWPFQHFPIPFDDFSAL